MLGLLSFVNTKTINRVIEVIKKETPEVPEGTPRGVRIKRGCSE